MLSCASHDSVAWSAQGRTLPAGLGRHAGRMAASDPHLPSDGSREAVGLFWFYRSGD